MPTPTDILLSIYHALHAHYGPQRWWPTHGDSGSRWEVMMGAVLTQHTTWTNVELALHNVLSLWGSEGLTRPEIMLEAAPETLASALHPAGFHTAKPRKLLNLARFVVDQGGVDVLARLTENTESLRKQLLCIWGIGPETADTILLYALDRPVFVADAYALRLASRWGLLTSGASYGDLRALFMDNLPQDIDIYNEYHALIVAHGKDLCRARPLCEACPLNMRLKVGQRDFWRCPKLHVKNRV
jgi:endonuclease III related protein